MITAPGRSGVFDGSRVWHDELRSPSADVTARLSPRMFEVVAWMENGIPLPAPTDWIGGPEPMPAGDVAYVRVGHLPPGRYAWITEKAPTTDGMVKTFVVEDP